MRRNFNIEDYRVNEKRHILTSGRCGEGRFKKIGDYKRDVSEDDEYIDEDDDYEDEDDYEYEDRFYDRDRYDERLRKIGDYKREVHESYNSLPASERRLKRDAKACLESLNRSSRSRYRI